MKELSRNRELDDLDVEILELLQRDGRIWA